MYLILLCVVLCTIVLQEYSFSRIINRHELQTGEEQIVKRYGTLINHIYQFFKVNEKKLISFFEYGRLVNKENQTSVNEHHKPNICLIQIESFDSSIINYYYQGKAIVPYLNTIAKNNIYYPYCLSYHFGGGSSDAEFSVVNNIQPLVDYVAFRLKNYEYSNSYLKDFKKANYDTLAFHGLTEGYYHRGTSYPKMGYDEYWDIFKLNLNKKEYLHHNNYGALDEYLFEESLKILNTNSSPFYAHFITLSSHAPFTVSPRRDNRFKAIEDNIVENYFYSMNYVDQCISNFVNALKIKHPETFFFIYGDHCPGIFSDKKIGFRTSKYSINNMTMEFVPLLILTPDGKKHREISKIVSFLDIGYSLLNAVEIDYSVYSFGDNLLMPNSISNEIPYMQASLNREQIFNQILKIINSH